MIAIEIPKYEYKPIRTNRLLLAEMPYGHAHMGAGYGEKNGPAIAAIGAVSSISAGFAAVGTLAGGLLIAGGALGLVGALTGNKTLSAIGSIAGLAGGFISPEGAFMNPFAEGAGESALSKGFGSVFDGLKESLGITSGVNPLPDFVQANMGEEIVGAAGGNGALAEAVKSSSVIDEAGGMTGSSGGGLLSKLGGMKDIMGAVSGAAEAYQTQPLINAKVDNLEANTDATQQQMGLIQQRQNNLQFQNTGNLAQVNENTQLYNTGPNSGAAPGKYAVVIGNEVKYVSGEEYQAIQAAKAQQQSGGMINQGVPA